MRRPKLMVVHPGASISVSDVHTGLRRGLIANGCEVDDYHLDVRIERAGAYLTHCWNKAKETQPDLPALTPSDFLYKAGEEMIARALRAQPDVVLIVSAMYVHPDIFVLLKRAGLKVACLFTESPYDDEKQVRLRQHIDVAWVNEITSAKRMDALYLRHAWTPGIHDDVQDLPVEAHDVVFVGTGFQERIDLLESTDWTGLNFGLYGSWTLLDDDSPLRPYLRAEEIDNTMAAALYRKAAIGLNLYRTSKGFGKTVPRIASADSLNPRAYELAATGCFTLSDARAEVRTVFGDLVPTFSNGLELRALIDRWLADPEGRASVQHVLPSVVSDETWHVRARTMLDDLRSAGVLAPARALSSVS